MVRFKSLAALGAMMLQISSVLVAGSPLLFNRSEPMHMDMPGGSGPGKGKAPAGAETPGGKSPSPLSMKDPLPGQPATDGEMQPFENLGRTRYNAWLFAASIEDVGRLMASGPPYGPDPLNKNWQRTNKDTFTGKRKYFTQVPMKAEDRDIWSHTLSGLADAYEAIEVGDGFKLADKWRMKSSIKSGLYSDGPNFGFKIVQDIAYPNFAEMKKDKAKDNLPATNGIYEQMFNIVSGVIVVRQNINPLAAYQSAHGSMLAQPPKYWTWSDQIWVAWKASHQAKNGYEHAPIDPPGRKAFDKWMYSCGEWGSRIDTIKKIENDMVGWLNYVFVTLFQQQDTINIMKRCLQARKIEKFPFYSEEPQTYPVGHWCFYALLATDDNNMIPPFLSQHRAEPPVGLGHKVLASVTIFAMTSIDPKDIRPDATDSRNRAPGLAWEIVDYSEDVNDVRETNEREWVRASGVTYPACDKGDSPKPGEKRPAAYPA